MLKKRIIPVVLLRNGAIVQSRLFKRFQVLGVPSAVVKRLSSWACDELIYLDISPGGSYSFGREDLNYPELSGISDVIELVSKSCLMPLTFGGGIRNIEDIRFRLSLGVDKITLNTAAVENPSLISEASKLFGSQCVVVSVDAKKNTDGRYCILKGGKELQDKCPVKWAQEVEALGAGEILLNSVDRDGTASGFDLELIEQVASNVKIPVIAIGGAGEWSHFEEVLLQTKASAVAAANIFQHSENSVYNLKKYLFDKGFNVRKPLKLSHLSSNL
ncbi:imidazole glycerol phosphate synthase subunit HisF [Peredibacter starrii]|uniref:imidazole glycerol-phosphate synthase n=1 Tax=Peredibacter starrii TaxID=28202 RepID=A0AAX4HRZ5_9BACT|nr:imidazole glycerol phosphate synthase cyclase subunit [Peredibacter starrii]WPU65836.1 imidazole glycerol phosphate synthase cyclase subunit [Peredibacter starrii]